MKNNVKNIISEAFDEIFEEMMNEDGVYTKKGMTSDQVDDTVRKALKRGYDPKLAYDFESGTEQQDNFNTAIDMLIGRYLNSEDETEKLNAKKAVQTAFSPDSKKLKNLFWTYRDMSSFDDVFNEAWEKTFLHEFDSIISHYVEKDRLGSGTFGGLIKHHMEQRMRTLFKNIQRTGSMDDEKGDNGHTLGDTIAAKPNKEYKEFDIQGLDSDTLWEIVRAIISYVNEVGDKRQALIFTELISGSSIKDIYDEFPLARGKTSNAKNLWRVAYNLFRDYTKKGAEKNYTRKPLANEINQMIAHNYGLEGFDISEINLQELAQEFSQNPDFHAKTISNKDRFKNKRDDELTPDQLKAKYTKERPTIESSTPEMRAIIDDIREFLDSNGRAYSSKDINPKISSYFNRKKAGELSYNDFVNTTVKALSRQGKNEEIDEFISLLEDLEDAKEKAKNAGKYGNPNRSIPKSDDDEDVFEKLYERVMKRISR